MRIRAQYQEAAIDGLHIYIAIGTRYDVIAFIDGGTDHCIMAANLHLACHEHDLRSLTRTSCACTDEQTDRDGYLTQHDFSHTRIMLLISTNSVMPITFYSTISRTMLISGNR